MGKRIQEAVTSTPSLLYAGITAKQQRIVLDQPYLSYKTPLACTEMKFQLIAEPTRQPLAARMRLSVVILGDFQNDPLKCFQVSQQGKRQGVVAESFALEVGLQ